ncbi:MAG: hypothetical protein EOM73_14040 [Bacteroidia bacterium]|nr:hypothetical protein [Bacteroidia bacterium]
MKHLQFAVKRGKDDHQRGDRQQHDEVIRDEVGAAAVVFYRVQTDGAAQKHGGSRPDEKAGAEVAAEQQQTCGRGADEDEE